MKQSERRDRGLAYVADGEVIEEIRKCRRILQRLNGMDWADFEGIARVAKELLGKSEDAFITPPFFCDYGSHIEVGRNFSANANCTILDVARVSFGDNCMLGPNVAIYTAGIRFIHPRGTPDMNMAVR